ncbi:MAG: hypothetical protein ACI30Q_09645, partial [Muribaculaceae bacterium]
MISRCFFVVNYNQKAGYCSIWLRIRLFFCNFIAILVIITPKEKERKKDEQDSEQRTFFERSGEAGSRGAAD